MKALKTILTVFFVIGCLFVCVASLGVYFSGVDDFGYQVKYEIKPTVLDTKVEKLGKTYLDQSEYERTYYQITYTIQNPSNYNLEEYSLHPYYNGKGKDDYYSIRTIDEDRPFEIYKDGYFYPSGKTAEFHQILLIEDGCEELEVRWYYDSNEIDIIKL